MSQSLARMWSHLIFSTKERHPFLADKEIREQLHAYMAAILRNHDCPTLQIGGATDHIHALFALSKNLSIAEVVYEVKRSSSKMDQNAGARIQKVPLAKRLRSFLRQSVSCRASSSVCAEPRAASSQDFVSRRVSRIPASL